MNAAFQINAMAFVQINLVHMCATVRGEPVVMHTSPMVVYHCIIQVFPS